MIFCESSGHTDVPFFGESPATRTTETTTRSETTTTTTKKKKKRTNDETSQLWRALAGLESVFKDRIGVVDRNRALVLRAFGAKSSIFTPRK